MTTTSSISNAELASRISTLVDRWNTREDQMIALLTQDTGDVTVTDGLGQNHILPSFPQLQKTVTGMTDELTGAVAEVRAISTATMSAAADAEQSAAEAAASLETFLNAGDTATAAAEAAQVSASEASQSAASASGSASASATSATTASNAATSAQASKDAAETARTEAASSATAANNSAVASANSATSAAGSASSASLSASSASESAASANTASTSAAASANAADTSATTAVNAKAGAETAAAGAQASADSAAASAASASGSASAAATSATTAGTHASNADAARIAAEAARDAAQDIAGGDFAASDHNHDTVYAQLGHGHSIGDISGLAGELAGKAASDHSHSGVYEPVFPKGALVAGSGARLAGTLSSRLVGTGDVTVAVGGAAAVSLSATTHNLDATHADRFLKCSNAAQQTLTILADANTSWPADAQIEGIQYGAGKVVVVGAAGVTIRRRSTSGAGTSGQYAPFGVKRIGANEWFHFGDLESA